MTPTTQRRAAAVAFLTAFVTLFIQVLVHRMVSAKLLNNYAFFVISLTMLGFALSGVILTRWLATFTDALATAVNACAALFALSFIGIGAWFYRADIGTRFGFLQIKSVAGLLGSLPLALGFGIPFIFCGLILGTLLAAPGLNTRRIYFADLVGSSLGAIVVIGAIRHAGVEAAAAGACAVMVAGVFAVAPPPGRLVRALAALALVASVGAAVAPGRVFAMTYQRGSELDSIAKGGPGYAIEYVKWDPLARVELSSIPGLRDVRWYRSLVGDNREFWKRFKKFLTQNNYAYTYAVEYDGNPASLTGIEETIYASAYETTSVKRPKVVIIGVGGGFDVLTGIFFDAGSITGVEINEATLGIVAKTYRPYFRAWVEDPRVTLVNAEGRQYLSSHDATYDVIQLSGVDSYSGTPGAANVFSESYLYTGEAFDLYLSRLTDQGILCMMRLEHPYPREMLRALTTAVAALRRAGAADPWRHVIMVTDHSGQFTSMLVKKTPFTEEEIARNLAWVSPGRQFYVSASPGRGGQKNVYRSFLALDDPKMEAMFLTAYPYDIFPVDDDRPFFFRYSHWSHLAADREKADLNMPIMEASITVLLLAAGLAALCCVLIPLLVLARRGLRAPGAARFGLMFAAVGTGYMAIEIALLQKFGLLLGHPNYSLSVVLAVLLLSSGLGSLWSARIVGALGGLHRVSFAVAAVLLAEYAAVFPRLLAMVAFPFWLKAAIVTALVFPVGMALGTFVPTALERIKAGAGAFAPWAWGINGIFSVMAPIAGAAVSMTWGINALLLSAIPVYLVAGFVLPREDRA